MPDLSDAEAAAWAAEKIMGATGVNVVDGEVYAHGGSFGYEQKFSPRTDANDATAMLEVLLACRDGAAVHIYAPFADSQWRVELFVDDGGVGMCIGESVHAEFAGAVFAAVYAAEESKSDD